VSARRSDILFLCVANSARSQLAEGWARKLAPAGVAIHSAGSEPGTLNPRAVRVMAERDIDLRGHVSKSISCVPAERIGLVVTLCAEEVCPYFPEAVERLHWPLADPAAVEGDDTARLAAFRSCRDEVERRLRALFARWPGDAATP
jgi:arsenate reductase